MRVLGFLVRWYLIMAAGVWIAAGPHPRASAGLLLALVVVNNWWHRRRLAQFDNRPQPVAPVAYPVPWPWYPPQPYPAASPQPPAPAPAPRASDAAGGEPPVVPPTGHGDGPTAIKSVAVVLAGLLVAGTVALARLAPAAAATMTAPPAVASASLTAPAAAGASAPSLGVPNPWQWLFQNFVTNPFKVETRATMKVVLDAAQAAFLTPPLTKEPRVQELWQLLLEIADSLLLLLIVVGAAMVVAGDFTYLEAKTLAPRVIVAGVAMNLSLVIVGQAISWSNALVNGFLSLGQSSLGPAINRVAGEAAAPILLALLLIALLLLLLANLIRLVVILVVTVGAPLLHVFGVLPATDGIARMWWRALAACLIAPVVQALLLVIGVWVTSSAGSPFQVVFDNPAWASLVDATMLLVIVVLMALSPMWMFKHALGSGHRQLSQAMRWGRRAVGVAV
jgi:hypothetical protein